jgi:hypothetical protein
MATQPGTTARAGAGRQSCPLGPDAADPNVRRGPRPTPTDLHLAPGPDSLVSIACPGVVGRAPLVTLELERSILCGPGVLARVSLHGRSTCELFALVVGNEFVVSKPLLV